VYIQFGRRKLEKCYRSPKEGEARWGRQVARRYIQRVDVLHVIERVDDLRAFPPFRFHRLKGGRTGQYAISLTDRVRLIFTVKAHGRGVIRVEEVSKHYGD
jgi:proteic killer suppression protein